MKLAFIGLGTMGYPIAGHLQNNGHSVTVYNRSSSKAEQWQTEYHGDIAPTPKQAVQNAELVMICVGNDNDLREVCFSEQGVISGLANNAMLVDHTTTSAAVAKEVAHACKQQRNGFLDAPVSGGEIGAVNGQLTIMVGGEAKVFEQAKPVLNCYAKKLAHLGPVGAGQTCKMVNQLCIAGILQGLAEGLTLAQESDLDLVQVRDVLKHGAAQSWQLEQRTQTIAEDKFNFGFAVDWMRKDLAICLESAKQLGLELPLAEMVDQSYAELQQQGHSRSDTSVLVKSVKT